MKSVFDRFGSFSQRYELQSISELPGFFRPEIRIQINIETLSDEVRNALELIRMNINHIINMIHDRADLDISEEIILDEINDVMQLYSQVMTGREFKIPRLTNYKDMFKDYL